MIGDLLFNQSKKTDSIALIYKRNNVTYSELYVKIRDAETKLKQYNIGENDRVLLFLPNSINFAIYFFALNYLRATIVFCDISSKDEVNDIVDDSQVTWIISNKKEIPLACSNSICHEDDEIYIHRIHNKQKRELFEGDSEISLILYTSGSTGKPKGVCNTNNNIIQSLKNYTQTVPISRKDTVIGVIPFHHSYGFGSCFLASLYVGAKLIVYDEFNPYKILGAMEQYNATIFFGVPYMYNIFIQLNKDIRNSFASVRMFISAGSRLRENIYHGFYNKYQKIICQEYGSSETGTISINLSNDIEKGCNSVGSALKNVLVYTTDQNDTLFVKSRAIAKCYTDGEIFDKDQYDTNDMGVIKNNYIFITGRKKNQINIAGLKVNPEEIEEIIMKHPSVTDVLVSSELHETTNEIIVAYVIKKDEFSEEELIRFCSKHMASYKVPRMIKWVEKIEKSDAGKTRSHQTIIFD